MGQVSAESTSGPKQTELIIPVSPTPYVFAIIENIAIQAFIDTGSEISLISETLRMSTPSLAKKPIQKSFLLAKSVTGDYLDTLGMLPITIRLGEEVFSHDVQVVRNAIQPVILGWDFLSKHHSAIDLRENHLKLWNRTVPLLCYVDPEIQSVPGLFVARTVTSVKAGVTCV